MNIDTQIALDAYWEEFSYFAKEADDFIALCREVFIENHGAEEAEKIDWGEIERVFV